MNIKIDPMPNRRSMLLGMAALGTVSACGGTADFSDGQGVVPASELTDVPAVQFRHADAVNALRASRGLKQLSFSQALNSAALTHARDMALQQRAWHFGSDRSNPQSRATRAGFGGRIIGENIAESFDGDIQTLQYWLERPDAASIILEPTATAIGFGWFQEPTGKLWWVQMIGSTGRPG